MRGFEKISFEQFKKDVKDDLELYEKYLLPRRSSTKAAGYDIYLLNDLVIEPGEIVKLPTGIKSYFEDDEVLFFIVRSSMGFKYNIRLCNQVGVVDVEERRVIPHFLVVGVNGVAGLGRIRELG